MFTPLCPYYTISSKSFLDFDGAKPREEPATTNPRHFAVEIKRVAGLDAVAQLQRYLDLLNRDPHLAPVGGVLAAQTIKPQARTLAQDRGIRCVILDYDALRGIAPKDVLF